MKLEKTVLFDINQYCNGEEWLFLGFCLLTVAFVLIGGFRKICKKKNRLLALSCLFALLSVRPSGITRLPLDRFSWNSTLEDFLKIYRGNFSLIKIWQGWRVLYTKTNVHFDMYMSYRWRESFNTVRSPSDSWRHHNGDWQVWAQNAERRGGMDHTSVAALTSQLCSDRGVVRVFEYSINVLYYKYGRNQSWRY